MISNFMVIIHVITAHNDEHLGFILIVYGYSANSKQQGTQQCVQCAIT